jgi:cysteinyl-tRNA synthetase
MITIEGKKMGKSYNNFITLEQFFSGKHDKLQRAWSPMTIRFFILTAHYRSTIDFSNDALEAAEKGFLRLQEAYNRLQKLQAAATTTVEVSGLRDKCAEAMDDDLNSPIVISHLFDSVRAINTVYDCKGTISQADLDELRKVWKDYAIDILGLRLEEAAGGMEEKTLGAYKGAVDMLLNMRLEAKQNKDWATSDKIRNSLSELGFQIKDTKDGFEWTL